MSNRAVRWVMAVEGKPPRVGPWRRYGMDCEVAILQDGLAVRARGEGATEAEAIEAATVQVHRALADHMERT